MFKRIKSGWRLTRKSWGVFRDNPGLIRFAVASGILSLLAVALVVGPGLYLIDAESQVIGGILVAVGIYLAAYISIYFAIGLAHSADRLMQGEETSFREGMAVAGSRASAAAGWAFVSVVVMTIIRAIQERFGIAGAIFGGLAAAAWGILTFLAVPVIAIEGTGPIKTLKRCAHLVKSRWGEQITGTVTIGAAVALLGILPGILMIVAGVALWATSGVGGAILIAVGLVVLVIAALIQQVLTTIFGVALYRYVADEKAIGAFTVEDMESAVRTKGGGATPGGPVTSASTI
ncbi:MAG: DUF6159 family protein [Solirubrobacterales bacterium]